MSKLDELIAELCPDGVEYYSLEEVTNIGLSAEIEHDRNNMNFIGICFS